MNNEEFMDFRSKFYYYCGRQFFIKELHKPNKRVPTDRDALISIFKKHYVKLPDFYSYYNLWRSCDQNVYIKYDLRQKKFLYEKKFNDGNNNQELYDYVNYEIHDQETCSERFGKSIKFFKFLCALIYTKSNWQQNTKEVLAKIEDGEIKIPSFSYWNRNIMKVVWDNRTDSFKLLNIVIHSEKSFRPTIRNRYRSRTRSCSSRSRSNTRSVDRSRSKSPSLLSTKSSSSERSRSRSLSGRRNLLRISRSRLRSISLTRFRKFTRSRSLSKSRKKSRSRSPSNLRRYSRSSSKSSNVSSSGTSSVSDDELYDENDIHPEDIEWEYEKILNEREVDGKIQYLIQWKNFGSYKFEPTWEDESMVDSPISRKKRAPISKLVNIENIENPDSVVEFYKKQKI